MPLTQIKLAELRRAAVPGSGNRLAKAIDLAGETQTSIGQSIGLPHTYVSDVARGRFQTITLDNAYKFSAFFGCQIEDLFPARETNAEKDKGAAA
jgi:transcriptional regulator with XRE-family HTH domain